MHLTWEQQSMLDGLQGKSAQKAMQILAALGKIYGAEEMIPVQSVQISGVSYSNLGEAGLDFLQEMADGGGKAKVLTTLNPAGMDIENWERLGISAEFADNQTRVIQAFERMGVIPTCSCTPYLFGNLPTFGNHIAWAESSAVCFANSILGARTNREGGPSALATALTGFTPAYGFHLDEYRIPSITFEVPSGGKGSHWFGSLGKTIGEKIEKIGKRPVPYISGMKDASLEELKSFCASIATFGGCALFHMEGITPEANFHLSPSEVYIISKKDIQVAEQSMIEADQDEIDFYSLGCPHLSLKEIAKVAELLQEKTVKREFWITTSRPMKRLSDQAGYSAIIEESGAKFAVDTCCLVAPIEGRFHAMGTDSAKACYYAGSKNRFKTRLLSFEDVVREATE